MDGDGDDLAGPLLALLPGLLLDLPDGAHGGALGVRHDLGHQGLTGLRSGHPGHRLQLAPLLLGGLLQLPPDAFQVLVALAELLVAALGLRELLLLRVLPAGQPLLLLLHLRAALADVLLRLPPHGGDLVLHLQQGLLGPELGFPLRWSSSCSTRSSPQDQGDHCNQPGHICLPT